jgi:hypothetical protein
MFDIVEFLINLFQQSLNHIYWEKKNPTDIYYYCNLLDRASDLILLVIVNYCFGSARMVEDALLEALYTCEYLWFVLMGGHQAQLPSCSPASGTTGPIVVIAPAGVSAVVSSCCEVSAVLRV